MVHAGARTRTALSCTVEATANKVCAEKAGMDEGKTEPYCGRKRHVTIPSLILTIKMIRHELDDCWN
jgi:hypothetical protein